MKKHLLSVLSVVLCVLLLAGCGETAPIHSTAPERAGADDASEADTAPHRVWQSAFIPLSADTLQAKLLHGAAKGETLYYLSTGVIADATPEGVEPEWPEQYWVYGPVIVQASLDGSAVILPYTPEMEERQPGVNSGVLFEQLHLAEDGSLWIVENHYRFEEESEAGEEEKLLVHLREDGSVLNRFPLRPLAAFSESANTADSTYSFTVSGLADDGNGTLCLAVHEWLAGGGGYMQSNRLYLLEETSGGVLRSLELDGEIAALIRLGSGEIVAASYQGATPVFSLVDCEKGELTEFAAAEDFISAVTGGAGDTLYYSAGNSLYSLDIRTAETSRLFDWSDCDVAHTDEDSICALADGRLVTTTGKRCADGVQNELVLLTPTEVSEVSERKILRMAVVNLYPFTSEMVSRFNRSQTEYRIEVTDYSRFNDYTSQNPEDWNAGLTRLQTELIAGNVPDILDISLLPVSRFGEKGLLEDLLPYLEADPELGMDQLNRHVLETFEENGKLYLTVSNYYIMTTLGLSEVVGSRLGWTMEEFSAAMQRLREADSSSTVFDVYTTRDDALTFLLYLQLGDYVDWSTGECRFDSDQFRQLLTFVRSFPTSFDWGADVLPTDLDSDSRLLSGAQLMKQCNLSCFEDVQRTTLGLGGAPFTYVGYPTQQGVGSMFAQIGNAFAISSSCPDKEAAWTFVRQFFLPVYQEQLSGSVFPTNLTVYEEMKHEAQSGAYKRNPDGSYALDADGKRIEADRGSVQVNGASVKLHAVSEEDIALVEQITEATTHVLGMDESLKEILVSNASAFFADQRSVDDAVTQIQSRATIYVNEQR